MPSPAHISGMLTIDQLLTPTTLLDLGRDLAAESDPFERGAIAIATLRGAGRFSHPFQGLPFVEAGTDPVTAVREVFAALSGTPVGVERRVRKIQGAQVHTGLVATSGRDVFGLGVIQVRDSRGRLHRPDGPAVLREQLGGGWARQWWVDHRRIDVEAPGGVLAEVGCVEMKSWEPGEASGFEAYLPRGFVLRHGDWVFAPSSVAWALTSKDLSSALVRFWEQRAGDRKALVA